jgi:DNA-binding response OmpR family regulator
VWREVKSVGSGFTLPVRALKPMTLLFIDDDPEDIELFRDAIKIVNPSYRCLTATNGDDGMKMLETVKPDRIFLDINMPGLGGWDLVKMIRGRHEFDNTPVYILSTSRNAAEREMFMRIGASKCLVKPSSFHELCEIFRTELMENDTR